MTRAADTIRKQASGFEPRVGIVLGTGLAGFADTVAGAVAIDYGDLEGFPATGVVGHAGRLVLGTVGKTAVAVCQGRAHYYEQGDPRAMNEAVRTLAAIGCRWLVLTNAAGSMVEEAGPGSVVAITDHINLVGASPLFGEKEDDRFVDLVDAYSPAIRARLQDIARRKSITLHEGVYAWFSGPHFETPAEIRMAAAMGAHVVGMSTVPEAILARHAGMEVAALSIITNMAAGMSQSPLGHGHVMDNAVEGAEKVQTLLTALLEG